MVQHTALHGTMQRGAAADAAACGGECAATQAASVPGILSCMLHKKYGVKARRYFNRYSTLSNSTFIITVEKAFIFPNSLAP